MKPKPATTRKPAKPAKAHDHAIRYFIKDLVERQQIYVFKDFSQTLGFKASQQLKQFLDGMTNYPLKRVDLAIKILVDAYGGNPNFLRYGQGNMYLGKPYVAPQFEVDENMPPNMLNISGMKKLQELEQINMQLKNQIQELEKLNKEKSDLINAQNSILASITAKKPAKKSAKTK